MQGLTIIQFQRGGCRHIGRHGGQPDIEPRLAKHTGQRGHIFKIKLIARVVLGNQQHIPGIRTVLLDRRLDGLDTQRIKRRIQIIETARKEVGVHRRQLETGITQIHGGVEGRCVILPGTPEPPFDRGRLIQKALFQRQKGAGKRRR